MNKYKMGIVFSGIMIIGSLFFIIDAFMGNVDFNISNIIQLFFFAWFFVYGIFLIVVYRKKLKENKVSQEVEQSDPQRELD